MIFPVFCFIDESGNVRRASGCFFFMTRIHGSSSRAKEHVAKEEVIHRPGPIDTMVAARVFHGLMRWNGLPCCGLR